MRYFKHNTSKILHLILNLRCPHTVLQKFPHFLKFTVSARTRGEPTRTFFGQGGRVGQFLRFFCGRLLWAAPNLIAYNDFEVSQVQSCFFLF